MDGKAKRAVGAILLAGVAYQLYVALSRQAGGAVVVPGAAPTPPADAEISPIFGDIASTLVDIFGGGAKGEQARERAAEVFRQVPASVTVPVAGALGLPPVTEIARAAVTGPRGIRNHNPGNLRRNGVAWQGLAREQTDREFYQFQSPFWGLRAMARVLVTYRARGEDTVREIVSRYAPPSENNTGAYVAAVSNSAGVGADQRIPSPAHWLAVMTAMIRHENGQQPYSAAEIQEAARAAGLV